MQKVLIVDNDPHLRLFYEMELQRRGYGTIVCASGAECLQILANETPDLVVMDIETPSSDGLEILQSIRSSHRELPIILNTAYTIYRENPRTNAADRCLIKSADTSELTTTIKRLLQERTRTWKTKMAPGPNPRADSFRGASFSGGR